MSIKPILFSTEMVRATQEDRKMATRRVVKGYALEHLELGTDGSIIGVYDQFEGRVFPVLEYAPYRSGDILWVREAWAQLSDLFDERPGYVYRADLPQCDLDELKRKKFRWRPSIHMPREAARLFLRVTDVRVERLWDIDESGARAEGCSPMMVTTDVDAAVEEKVWHEWAPALPGFIILWDSTVKPADRTLYGWAANPWVWVIGFERCEKPEAVS